MIQWCLIKELFPKNKGVRNIPLFLYWETNQLDSVLSESFKFIKAQGSESDFPRLFLLSLCLIWAG